MPNHGSVIGLLQGTDPSQASCHSLNASQGGRGASEATVEVAVDQRCCVSYIGMWFAWAWIMILILALTLAPELPRVRDCPLLGLRRKEQSGAG
jgi:hypothetical protein